MSKWGGKFMEDLDKMMPFPSHNSHQHSRAPDVPQHDSLQHQQKIGYKPRQPNDYQSYPLVEDRLEHKIRDILSFSTDEVIDLSNRRVYEINKQSERLKNKLERKRKSNLPDDLFEKIDDNDDEILENINAIEGHKTTVSNGFSVFGNNGWSDLKGLCDEFMKSCKNYDMASAVDVAYKFIVGIMTVLPSLLELSKRYDKVVKLQKENLDLIIQAYESTAEERDKLEEKIFPKKIVDRLIQENRELREQAVLDDEEDEPVEEPKKKAKTYDPNKPPGCWGKDWMPANKFCKKCRFKDECEEEYNKTHEPRPDKPINMRDGID